LKNLKYQQENPQLKNQTKSKIRTLQKPKTVQSFRKDLKRSLIS
jgi:hypothetical protein